MALCLCTGPYQLTDLHTRDVDHLVEERLGYLYGPPTRLDNVKRPLRHDRDVNDVSSPRYSPQAATVGAKLSPHDGNCGTRTTDTTRTSTTVCTATGEISMVCQAGPVRNHREHSVVVVVGGEEGEGEGEGERKGVGRNQCAVVDLKGEIDRVEILIDNVYDDEL